MEPKEWKQTLWTLVILPWLTDIFYLWQFDSVMFKNGGFDTFLLKQEFWTSNPIQDIHLADKEAWKQPNIPSLHEDTLFT